MAPRTLSRRNFLGTAAGIAAVVPAGLHDHSGPSETTRLAFVGLGNRGTALLRAALEIPGVQITALCDADARHLIRSQGIVEKAQGSRPELIPRYERLLEREDIDGVVAALPCDLHATVYLAAIAAAKHLYAEKPLAITVADGRRIVDAASANAHLAFHVGFQRRSHPRFIAANSLVRQGELGMLIDARASWISSQGPLTGHDGWLARRARSGDWMVEHAAHVWDLWHWMTGELPQRAFGAGRRDVFRTIDPHRDVTDLYHATLEWADGFVGSFVQSWADPAADAFTGVDLRLVGADGGIDLQSGVVNWRDRNRPKSTLAPGNPGDTRLALESFVGAIRATANDACPPPPPVSPREAHEATITGLMVRKAIDERRVVNRSEIT